jgi:hypothetical protein
MKLLRYLRIFSKIITALNLIQRPILSKMISNLSSLVCQVTNNFEVSAYIQRTNSTEQSPFCKANRSSASQAILSFL